MAFQPGAQALFERHDQPRETVPRSSVIRWSMCAWMIVGATSLPGVAETNYGKPERTGELENKEIDESSGLAASRRHPGLFWTHNDSGDEPRIFAFDQQGKHHGTCRLKGAEAVDWEDMGAFSLRGHHYLFVADVGGNVRVEVDGKAKVREEFTIYLAAEPKTPENDTIARPLHFRYEDGPRDCEAVALDTARQVFILVEKIRLGAKLRTWAVPSADPCRIYELPWKAEGPNGARTARCIGQLRLDKRTVPWVTGIDISPDGRRAVMVTYGSIGMEFSRRSDESWRDAFARPPKRIALPRRRQGESVCYGLDGVTLYLTSEKKPCPLFVIRPVESSSEF